MYLCKQNYILTTAMNEEWIGISEYAKMVGKSKQTIYNWVKRGKVESKTFSRGSMRGILIKATSNE